VIGVRMANEDGVHRAKPAVVPAPYRISRIIQNTHAGWIFKQKSSSRAQKFPVREPSGVIFTFPACAHAKAATIWTSVN
jgi:hypothetical protein